MLGYMRTLCSHYLLLGINREGEGPKPLATCALTSVSDTFTGSSLLPLYSASEPSASPKPFPYF